MILGIGTDFMKVDSLHESVLQDNDSFLVRTYTKKEIKAATERLNPHMYYALRFSAKEAVFKCLGICGDHIKMTEIEILSYENGQPYVVLHGEILKKSQEKGIEEVLITLSYDDGYVQAFAVAQGR